MLFDFTDLSFPTISVDSPINAENYVSVFLHYSEINRSSTI